MLCLAGDRDKVALWNPSTREFKILPESSVQHPPLVDSTSFDCLGFGYDSQTDDYKVATGSSGCLILSFDMVNEKFSTSPWPQTLNGFYSHLLDFNGLLGAMFYQGKGTEDSYDLWVMNGSWTKQFNIESVPGVERLLGL
ncbi:hypothetical protein V6N13_064438 [Hibiscus sabdariffa]|uniref:F-box protein n=1 Tax=Hibiscus sabdariffa TaxID=183260 RepID=A0ABR2EBV4_9ROSI